MLKRKGHLGAGAVSEGLAIFIKIEGYFWSQSPVHHFRTAWSSERGILRINNFSKKV